MKLTKWIIFLGLFTLAHARAAEPIAYPAAIFPFEERGAGAKGLGSQVADLLFSKLVASPDLMLVDRADLEKVLGEMELNLSGAVSQNQAVQVGQLVGARLLITGSVIDVDKKIILVAKVIGTETGRVLGESAEGTGRDELTPLVSALAQKVLNTISNKAVEIVPAPVTSEDRAADLNKKLGDAKRPVVMVNVAEHHVGQPTVDPAAETELAFLLKETGFTVLDSAAAASGQADITIEGEGFSEFALRRGNLVSVKARLEIKVVDRKTGEVIATDRQNAVRVDLTELLAGKAALQEAAGEIAERLLPKLVTH